MDLHVDYPHHPGTLYDCYACEEIMDDENDENTVLDWELEDETLSGPTPSDPTVNYDGTMSL